MIRWLRSKRPRGELDELSGRHIDLAREDWKSLPGRAAEIAEKDLLALRLRR